MYEGKTQAPLIAVGLFGKSHDDPMHKDSEQEFLVKIEIPNMLSYMAFLKVDAFVPGIKDLVLGNEDRGIMSFKEKIRRGYEAQQVLRAFKDAKGVNPEEYKRLKAKFDDQEWVENYFRYFGYGNYYDPDPQKLESNAFKIVPPISLSFYAFHIMVILGGHFLLLFMVVLWLTIRNKVENRKIVLYTALWTIPLAYIASQAGWVVAEVGRQPWVIQDLMPTMTAVSKIDSSAVMITFALFTVTFVALAIAEVKIMVKQIKNGPKDGGNN